jgi:hypothetical protein
MNLVKDIMDQFSGDLLGKLSSLLNADEDSVNHASNAAVPALLAGISSLASNNDGARKITNVLSSLGSSGLGDVMNLLRNDPSAAETRGTSLLTSLFGDNMLTNLAGMLGKSSGLSGNMIQKLLAFLAPMVLGKVASVWQNKGGTAQALTNLMSEQRNNISAAMPAGFSLADIPGWSAGTKAPATRVADDRYTTNTRNTRVEAAPRSAASWVVPLLLGAVGLFVLWSILKPRADETARVDRVEPVREQVVVRKPITTDEPAALNISQVNDDLRGIFTRAGDVFADIKDASSAAAAQTQLEQLEQQIDTMKATISRLPATGLATVIETADTSMAKLKDNAAKTLETPGLPAEIRSLIETILRKLAALFVPAQQ